MGLKFLLIPIQSVLARMAGGGLGADKIWKPLPEILFSIPFFFCTDNHYLGALAVVWSYLFMQTGHGTAFRMGYETKTANSGRKQFLSPVIDPICEYLNKPLGGLFYCWIFMGLKGVLIHAPLGLPALLAFIFWPLSYLIGNTIGFKTKNTDHHIDGGVVNEMLSGAFSGLLLYAVL